MTGTLDPRIAWQRALVADRGLSRSTRGIALTMGAQLSYQGGLSIGVGQLVELTGYSDATVRRALDQLRSGGWIERLTRGYRGRTSTYQAAQPALLSAGKYRSPVSAIPAEYRSPVSSGPVEYRSPVSASDPNSAHPGAHSSYENEDESSSFSSRVTGRPSAAQGPLLAAVTPPEVAAVLAQLPAGLLPRSGRDESRLRQLIGQRLAAGWSAVDLVEVAGTVGDVPIRDAPAMFARHVPTQPPREPGLSRPAPRPPWCGSCDEPTRLLDLDDGGVTRCPSCHPLVVGVAL